MSLIQILWYTCWKRTKYKSMLLLQLSQRVSIGRGFIIFDFNSWYMVNFNAWRIRCYSIGEGSCGEPPNDHSLGCYISTAPVQQTPRGRWFIRSHIDGNEHYVAWALLRSLAVVIHALEPSGQISASTFTAEEDARPGTGLSWKGGSEQNFTLDSSNHQACSSIILFLPLSDTDARCSNAAISLKLKDQANESADRGDGVDSFLGVCVIEMSPNG